MNSTRLTQLNHNSASSQLNVFQSEMRAVTLSQTAPTAQSTSLLSLAFQGVSCFVRWLTAEPSEIIGHRVAANSYPVSAVIAACNQQGMEIIKRFEGYPSDIEPDVREAERVVRQFVQVPLTANQFSALVSFTFNVGEATFRKSALLKYLNAGRYRAAARDFDHWVYIGSKRFPKLVARRVAEAALFIKE